MNNSISLCVICKNEEDQIENCLNSVKDIVDEIIIIDTGSNDKTISKAINFDNVKVFEFKWDNDFSLARNFAMSKVKTNWTLFLDADEILKGDLSKIKEKVNQEYEKTPVFFFNVYSRTSISEKPKYYQKQIRLFKNDPNLIYQNMIFENLVHVLGNNNVENYSINEVAIDHNSSEDYKFKVKRNISILSQALKNNPNSFFYNYKMGKECYKVGLYNKSLDFYLKATKCEDQDSIYFSDISTDIIKILYKHGQTEEALNECIRKEKLCEYNFEFWLVYAFLGLRTSDVQTAKYALGKTIKLKPQADMLTVNISNLTWKPLLMMGFIEMKLKNYDNAKEYLEKAKSYNDQYWLLLFYLGVVYRELNENKKSESYFQTVEQIIPENYQQDLNFNQLLTYIMSNEMKLANQKITQIINEYDFEEQSFEMNLLDYEQTY